MTKRLLIIGLLVTGILSVKAQEDTTKYWKLDGIFNLSVNQTGLVNWTAGGENSVSGNVLLKYSADYAKGVWKWDNDFTIGYGGIVTGAEPWKKTDDRIEFESKAGREMTKNWYYSAFLNFRTQMVDGFAYPNDSDLISTWMAPGYITLGLGAEYAPNKFFSANFAAVSSKITVVNNQTLADAGAYGVEGATYDETTGALLTEGNRVRTEIGGNVTLIFKKEIFKNVKLDTKLNLFSNYAENPQNIDVNWDLLLTLKVNEWLAASVTTNLIYDHDIDVPLDSNDDGVFDSFGPRTQFKEVIGVGLNLAF